MTNHIDPATALRWGKHPKVAEFLEVRGLHEGDWALDCIEKHLVLVLDSKPGFETVKVWGSGGYFKMKAADCTLLLSESDMLDLLEADGVNTVCFNLDTNQCFVSPVVESDLDPAGIEIVREADTRRAALVACVDKVLGEVSEE